MVQMKGLVFYEKRRINYLVGKMKEPTFVFETIRYSFL